MYICICNALNERTVRSVAAESNGCLKTAMRNLGYRPKCGKCLSVLQDTIVEAGATDVDNSLRAAI